MNGYNGFGFGCDEFLYFVFVNARMIRAAVGKDDFCALPYESKRCAYEGIRRNNHFIAIAAQGGNCGNPPDGKPIPIPR